MNIRDRISGWATNSDRNMFIVAVIAGLVLVAFIVVALLVDD